MLTLTFALSSVVMYINFETKQINEKKLDCEFSVCTHIYIYIYILINEILMPVKYKGILIIYNILHLHIYIYWTRAKLVGNGFCSSLESTGLVIQRTRVRLRVVLLAGFNTSKNRKTEKTPAYFVGQSDAQSIFNHASVLGAKLRRYLCARSVFKLNLIANAQKILRWEMFPIS